MVISDMVKSTHGKVDAYLADLGSRHQRMGIEKQHLDVMGPIFCQSIRPVLQVY